jgi:membrane-associated phospholipid phosphatase
VLALVAVSLKDPGGARRVIVDWLPFIAILLAYDLLRGAADGLLWGAKTLPQLQADELLFGGTAPTVRLQDALYDPNHHRFYDYATWAVYMTHFFVVPLVAAVLWRKARPRFRKFAVMVAVLSLAGFATYALYPAVPPWMASQGERPADPRLTSTFGAGGIEVAARDALARTEGRPPPGSLIHRSKLPALEPTSRIVENVWGDVGLQTGEAIFEKGSRYSNQVAAVPSLHAAFPMLLLLFFWGGGWRVRAPLAIYTLAMGFALTYSAEHYAVDVLLGWIYAVAVYFGVANAMRRFSEWRETRAPPLPAGEVQGAPAPLAPAPSLAESRSGERAGDLVRLSRKQTRADQ